MCGKVPRENLVELTTAPLFRLLAKSREVSYNYLKKMKNHKSDEEKEGWLMYISVRGRHAIYQNREFELEEELIGSYMLTSRDANDTPFGLNPVKGRDDRFIKRGVSLDQFSFAYWKKTYAVYEGTKFQAMEIKDGLIMLRFPYNETLLKRYEDRVTLFMDFYEMWVPLKDITEITQVWKPLTTWKEYVGESEE